MELKSYGVVVSHTALRRGKAVVLVNQIEAETLFNKNLATLVKELRGKLSLREFADIIGSNHVSVRLWESGKGEPRMRTLSKIASLKGWTLDELMLYLEGELLPKGPRIPQLLAEVRSLPSEAVAQVAAAAVEILATRSSAFQTTKNSVDSKSVLSA